MKMFTGLIPPMVTPLSAPDRLDVRSTERMVRHLVFGGVDGIFLLGTTGEGPHLPYSVREALVKKVCAILRGRLPVLVGVTETDMDAALRFAGKCRGFGASAVVAAPPHYFRPTQDECVSWFAEMADRMPLPLVVYNMPAHTGTVIEPSTIAKLAAHPNIVAMKDSSSIIALFNKFKVALRPFAEKFSLFMGPDEAMGEAVATGADGGVCTGANLWPRTFKSMYEAAVRGDIAEVRRLQEITTTSSSLLYGLGSGQSGFLKGVKAALSEMGLVENVLSVPFTPFGGSELRRVRAAVAKLRRMGAQ